MEGKKVLISERALTQRLNRALADDDIVVKKSRPREGYNELGDFYLISLKRNFIVETDVDIEALARKKGVLAKWEALETKEG
jgi:hypothetical protein